MCHAREPLGTTSMGLASGQLTVGGITRSYALHVPPGPAPTSKRPLVIAFHGRGGTGPSQEILGHLSQIADAHGFVVVFPDGIRRSWNDSRGTTPASQEHVDDLGFVRALIDKLVAEDGVDPTRVYATGMSNGAEFTYTVACQLGDKIAGVAPVAGLMPVNLVGHCNPPHPMPIVVFAGTADPLIPYAGGTVRSDVGGEVRSATDTFADWAKIDGCTGKPTTTAGLPTRTLAVDDGTKIVATTYDKCAGGATVTLVTIQNGGHTWPSGWSYAREKLIGKTTGLIDAGEWMWLMWTRGNQN